MNLLAVFGAIHFYTQYFERLGASPGSVLVAGLAAIAIAFGIGRYNRMARQSDSVNGESSGESVRIT